MQVTMPGRNWDVVAVLLLESAHRLQREGEAAMMRHVMDEILRDIYPVIGIDARREVAVARAELELAPAIWREAG